MNVAVVLSRWHLQPEADEVPKRTSADREKKSSKAKLKRKSWNIQYLESEKTTRTSQREAIKEFILKKDRNKCKYFCTYYRGGSTEEKD